MINQLLDRALKGDKKAENEIFEELSVSFRLIAGHKVKDRNIAEEIAQKTCLTILEKYKGENFTVSFEAWAYGVLRMNIRNYFAAKSGSKTGEFSLETTGDQLQTETNESYSDLEDRLLKCLEKILKINLKYARVLNLIYQGYKTDEICKRLDIKRDYLYVILNRARSMLLACLNKGE